MKRIIRFFKNLRCKHEKTLTITNLSGNYKEIYEANSIRICSNCGKFIKSNETQKINVTDFIPEGDD